jgi:hypothetical protein
MSDNVKPNVELKISSEPSITLLLGKQGSGKTHLLRDLFYALVKNDFYEFGYAYSTTHHYASEKDKLSFLEDKHVHRGFNQKHLEGYVDALTKLKEELKKDNKPMPHNFIIFDDCLKLMHFNDDWVANWLARFRHTDTDLYFTAQYLKGGLGTTFREYCARAFMFAQESHRSIEGIYKEFGYIWYDNVDDFIKMYVEATKPKHQCVVYVRGQETREQSWFTHMAGVPPKYVFKYNIP